jgi:hypothetical protein
MRIPGNLGPLDTLDRRLSAAKKKRVSFSDDIEEIPSEVEASDQENEAIVGDVSQDLVHQCLAFAFGFCQLVVDFLCPMVVYVSTFSLC